MGELDLYLTHGSLGQSESSTHSGRTRVLNRNGISIGSTVFAGLTTVTDGQTDRPTDHAAPSVTIGRIYVGNFLPAFI